MFWRVVFKLLRGSSGRLAVAVIALVSGAAVISALMNLDLDVERKLTQEFRSLGANVVVSAAATSAQGPQDAPTLLDETKVTTALAGTKPSDPGSSVFAAAPFLYVVARSGSTPVVVAGTWLGQLSNLNPTWKLDGQWPRIDTSHTSDCYVGRNVARTMHASVGSTLPIEGSAASATCNVAGVIDSGANDDNQIFADLQTVQSIAGLSGRVTLAQIGISGGARAITSYAQNLAAQLPDYQVRPIRQVADAEGSLLARIRLLIVAMIILILVLTAFCVLGTMAALAMERREDVGLMKALGGSIARVVGIFLAEVGVLGAVGGAVGSLLGFVLSYWMGKRVFDAAISPRWEVFPITVALMIVVALAGALPLRLLGNVKPAVIFRGE